MFKVKPPHEMEQAERFRPAHKLLVGAVGCGGDHQAAGELGHTRFSLFVPSPATAAPDAPVAAGGATYGRLKMPPRKISCAKLVGNGVRINKKFIFKCLT